MNQNPASQGNNLPNQGNQPEPNLSIDANSGGSPDLTPSNPLTNAVPVDSVVEPAVLPKKKYKGLIFAIVFIVILLLTLGGFAAWYFLYYNNPEKVAYDAIDGFLRQQTVVSEGIITGRAQTDFGEVLVTISTDNKSTTTSADSTVTVKIDMLDANGETISDNQYELELGGIMMSDGVIYIRTGKLMESIDLFMDDMNITLDEFNTSGRAIYSLLEDIDGEWWQISVPDIIDDVVEDSSLAYSSKEFYACLVNVAHSDVNGEIADIYSQNRFVNIAKSNTHSNGVTDYNVTFDYDKMTSFANSLLDSNTAKNTQNCLEKYVVDDLDGNLEFENTPADAQKLQDAFKSTNFTLSISDFGHELRAIGISIEQGDSKFSGGFSFAHPEVTVEAPANYQPFSNLVDRVVEAITEIIDTDYVYGDDYEYDFDDDYFYDDWYSDEDEGGIEEV